MKQNNYSETMFEKKYQRKPFQLKITETRETECSLIHKNIRHYTHQVLDFHWNLFPH